MTDVSDWDMPHEKYAVLVGENEKLYGFCLINTESSEIPAKVKFQVKILIENNKFLDHDSFVDCASLFYIDKTKVDGFYKNGKLRFLGPLYKDDLEQVLTYGKSETNVILTKKQKLFFS